MALVLAMAASTSPAPPAIAPWRVIDRPDMHLGVRPFVLATSDGPELAAGVTVQLSLTRAL